MMETLCRLDEIPEGDSKGFEIGAQHLFVVRRGGRIYAYENRCPHTGAPLDWVPNRFLSADGALIQCANHDARFRIEDGLCVAGPCAGASLTPVPVAVIDGRLVLGGETAGKARV